MMVPRSFFLVASAAVLFVTLAGCPREDGDGGRSSSRDTGEDAQVADRGDRDRGQTDLGRADLGGIDAPVDMERTDQHTDSDEPFCQPYSESTCSCPESGTGTMVCNAAGTAYGSCSCDPVECTSSSFNVTGTLQTGVANIAFDSALVTVTASHKLDIDEAEDGCLANVTFEISANEHGCTLNFTFGAYGLIDFEFSADSFCPGFPDDEEGYFFLYDEGYAPFWLVGPTEVSERLAETTCLATTIGFPDHDLVLAGWEGETLEVNLSGLHLSGTLYSTGLSEARCPVISACGDGTHEGGGGYCVSEGACVPGAILTYSGTCLDESEVPGPECADDDLGSDTGSSVVAATLTAGGGATSGSCGGGDGAEVQYFWTAPSTHSWYFQAYSTSFTPIVYVRRASCIGAEEGCEVGSGSYAHAYAYVREGESVVVYVDSESSYDSGQYTLTISY